MSDKPLKNTRYRSIFEASIDAIFVINHRGIIEDVNNAGLELFGYSINELLGNNVKMLMDEPHYSKHDGYLSRYQKTGEARIIGLGREVIAKKKNGQLFPIRLAVSEFEIFGTTFYTGVIHDQTEEHQIREELRDHSEKLEQKVKERTLRLENEVKLKEKIEKDLIASQKLYEAIAVNFPNGTISVLDRELNIIFIEGTELRDSGYDTRKLTGQNYISLIPNEVADNCRRHIEEAFEGEYKVFEISHGEKVYLARTVPLSSDSGTIDRVLHVEINITSQKRAEEEIYNALNKEKQLNELKSRFVSMASHEFRTPLSSILSSASLIEKYATTEQQDQRSRHINKIKSNVRNLDLILNDFLSLEKIEGGLIKNNPQEVILSDFIHEIVEETAPLKKPNQKVVTELSHMHPGYELDPFLLRNIMNNLLSNAYKYSPEGSEIYIITRSEPNLEIQVSDSGIGISDDDQKQLFNRFFRASNATNIQGTGLGLNIVKRYADIMGAEVKFESELNQGSSFTILFI